MTPFDRILVPTDFSPYSDEAIRYAADLSQRYGAPVTLCHVYHPVAYPLPEGFVLYSAEQLTGLLSEFRDLLAKAKVQAESVGALEVGTKLLQGVVFDEVVRFADDEGYDLIVMGTHGRTGLKHAFMGSVTEKVVRTARCPVLTVHAPPSA
jgi:nucleotide-binding universal stress UspA family protein